MMVPIGNILSSNDAFFHKARSIWNFFFSTDVQEFKKVEDNTIEGCKEEKYHHECVECVSLPHFNIFVMF